MPTPDDLHSEVGSFLWFSRSISAMGRLSQFQRPSPGHTVGAPAAPRTVIGRTPLTHVDQTVSDSSSKSTPSITVVQSTPSDLRRPLATNDAVLLSSFVDLHSPKQVGGWHRSPQGRSGCRRTRQESHKTIIAQRSLPSSDGEGQDWLWLAVVYGILRSVRGRESR
jgi:hypothetical protein